MKMIGELLRDFIGANYSALYFDEKYSDLKGANAKPNESKLPNKLTVKNGFSFSGKREGLRSRMFFFFTQNQES